MFTDMVGYSALSQKNESLALELLEDHRHLLRPLFIKHHGREVETAGDSFFVEFASALDAARCAIEIQRTMHDRNAAAAPARHIMLRIGLHLGDVVHQGKHVHGDGVNIAARIEPCAPPGGICVSEDVARQIENKIELKLVQLRRQELKNIALPVSIYRIVLPWEVAATKPARQHSTRAVRYGAIGVLAVVAILATVLYFARLPSADHKSLAVLPFENLSTSAENEYFSDGITEDVIAHLSKIKGLRVISRTSVMRYKGRERNVPEIARDLHVAAVLEGSVRREGDRVRVVVQLIDAESDQHLWVETYDEQMTGIFSIQSDVARKIAGALEARISPEENELLERQGTGNLEAYDLYLQGRYYWNKRLPDKLQKGIQLFKQAIAKDSTYALAYAGLADSYTILGNFNLLAPHYTYPEAKAAALKALALDSSLAEAHASLGFAMMNYDWNWTGAERELTTAAALNPNNATARSWHAFLLTITGRFAEATRIHQEALDLDPLSSVINADVGLTMYFSRRYDEAVTQYKKTLELDPTFVLANIPLGGAYVQQKKYNEAIAAYQHLTAGLSLASIRHPLPIAALACAYAAAGRKDDALMMSELLDEMAREQYVAPYLRAIVAAGMEDKENALRWLEKALGSHDAMMVFLKVDPVFDPLRAEPRFMSLLKRMALD